PHHTTIYTLSLHDALPISRTVEFLSLTAARGAQLRATVSSFGPLLLAKVLGLNDTQTSVLSLVFKFCDDQKLPLIDFADLRAVRSEEHTSELQSRFDLVCR